MVDKTLVDFDFLNLTLTGLIIRLSLILVSGFHLSFSYGCCEASGRLEGIFEPKLQLIGYFDQVPVRVVKIDR